MRKMKTVSATQKVHWVGGWMMEVKAILKGILKTIKKVWWDGEWM